MATQTVLTTSRGGVNLTTLAVAAEAGGDKWLNTGAEMLYIKSGGTPITLTLAFGVNAPVDSVAPVNRTVAIAANREYLIGPFPTLWYNDSTGYMNLAYSAVTAITILPFKAGT